MTVFQIQKQAVVGYLTVFMLVLTPVFPVLAESGLDECYKSDIDYSDNPTMTQAERLEAMNAAFFDSINRFEECVLSNNASTSNTGNAGSNGGGAAGDASNGGLTGTEGLAEETGQAANPGSVASGELSGTEIQPSESIAFEEQPEISDAPPNINESIAANRPAGQGKAPEDIPPAANDDAVAAQIRLAAEMESDPVKKERLWNEYRKYKGLPVKDDE